MTRRIAAAILLTSWAILLFGGAASYVSIRRVLLAELDDSLVLRASSLPEVLGVRAAPAGGEPRAAAAAVPAGDRYVIRDGVGRTVARPTAAAADAATATAGGAATTAGRVLSKSFATLADGSRTRTVTVMFPGEGGAGGRSPLTVIYSGSANRYDQVMGRLAWVLVGIVLGAGAIVAAVAVGVAHVALRPLRAAAGTLATIDDRTLDRRLDAASLPAEIRPVGERMNQLLARLERGIGERKRFLADAAHELRTPVAALTTTIEVALRRPREAASLAGTLRDCLADARLLRRLVEMLLEQFRLDANPAEAAVVETDVSALLDLCAEAAGTAAKVRGVTVVRSYGPDVRFPTRPERLRSVVGNLLCNGIEYSGAGGEVEVGCGLTEGGGLLLTVRDTGPGIAPSERGRVFEPFYRPGAGASCGEGHAGLGLYLVRAHVQALGGTCRLESPAGGGSEFRVELPRPPGTWGDRVAERADAHELLTHAH